MDKVALGQVFLHVLRFSPVSIIPPVLHIHARLHVALTRSIGAPKMGGWAAAPPLQNEIKKNTDFVGTMVSRFYVTYASAKISH